MYNFYSTCLDILLCDDTESKFNQLRYLYHHYDEYTFDKTTIISIPVPGRPVYPKLISPLDVPKRKIHTKDGLASLYHALIHIEFNAINLALDACYRFQEMPKEFSLDWLNVAYEELSHFILLDKHLNTLGYQYGDFEAHNGLWDMVHKTEHDPLIRMALVPRVLEARGVDAIPDIINKLSKVNDYVGINILNIIAEDEIKHVQIGNKWYQQLCKLNSLDPMVTFFNLLEKYEAPKIRGAFNRHGRIKAGFSEYELDLLLQRTQNE